MTPKDRIQRLEEDNERLRKEVERLRKWKRFYIGGELRVRRALRERK